MDDINGHNTKQVLAKVGWVYLEEPARALITTPGDEIAAIGWAAMTSRGLNLSYATAYDHEGRGLALIAIACAILVHSKVSSHMLGADPGQLQAHAQFRTTNPASKRVAEKLGLRPCRGLAFSVELPSGTVKYRGSQCGLSEVLDRCTEIIDQATAFPADRVALPGNRAF